MSSQLCGTHTILYNYETQGSHNEINHKS